MPDAIHTALLNALLSCLMFLEQADDTEVDPDSAVRTMENATAAVLELAETDRSTLVMMFHRLADREPDEGDRAFILNAPFALGLVESA